MAVNPTKQELKKAYDLHKIQASKANNISTKTLWFYAAECGLKSYYLKLNNLPDANRGNLKNKYGHKLHKLVQDCRLPNISPPIDTFNSNQYPLREFHEVMRYGSSIPQNVEISQLEYIKKIVGTLIKII